MLEDQKLYCTGSSLLSSRCELQNKIEYKVERAKLKIKTKLNMIE